MRNARSLVGSVRRRLARRSLKPQLNQIRTWVRQGRTDAWIAHQLEVSVGDIRSFKREHELVPDDSGGDADEVFAPGPSGEELDLRAEDDALVAAALEAEQEEDEEPDEDEEEDKPKRRRRGRRGGRGRRRRPTELEGTFDHGDEGYGLWLDPAIQDDPVYAEHWAGHRPVTVTVEAEQIVIKRAGEEPDDDDSSD
jgi:hypothetical protein